MISSRFLLKTDSFDDSDASTEALAVILICFKENFDKIKR